MPPHISPHRLPRIAAIAASSVAAASLTSGLLSRAGAWLPWADFLNQFAPLWLSIGLATAALAFCLGTERGARTCPAIILGSLIVLAIDVAGPEFLASLQDRGAQKAGPPLRVIQFNVWDGNRAPAATAAWLAHQDADVILLEETIGRASLPDLLRPLYPYQQSCLTHWRCSTMILSRWKPIASAGLANGDPENRQTLSAAWMRFATACGPLTIVATHLSRPWPWSGSDRDLGALLGYLMTQDRARLLLTGDFNLTPWSFQLQRFDRASGLNRLTHGTATWPTPLGYGGLPLPPALAIDQIYAGSALTLSDLRRGGVHGSDHYPLIADLRDRGCERS